MAPGTHIGSVDRSGIVLAAAAALIMLTAAGASASVTLVDYPQGLLALTDRATVTWEEQARCFVAYGPAPGVYSSRTVTEAVGELTFVPFDEGFLPGVHFCVLREVATGEDCEEFQIIVESPLFPEPRTPPNGTSVDETTTLLEWDPVDRVPYYHVVVSDHEIEISEEDGEIVLTGANVIWQAITSGTSIQYGDADPSEHFIATNGVSPPLMSGFTYNWLVFNNYGNHPLLTSPAGAGISGFTADVTADVVAPQLVAPPDDIAIAEDVLDFDWVAVPGACGYHLYIHEKRTWAGGIASYPVWDGATTGTAMEVHAGEFLPRGEYYWRVVALDASGRGACSESRRLNYETETGQARIVTTNEAGEPLPWVFVQTEFTQGGVEVFPVITNEDGIYEKSLIPGDYTFRATKDGHVDTLSQATVRVNETTNVALQLRRCPARIRGAVRDELGQAVFDATVRGTFDDLGVSTQTNNDGNFVLAVRPGEWTVVAEKQGYASSSAVSVSVGPGDYFDIPGPLTLLGVPGTVSGTVVNSSGNPLAAATVKALCGTHEESAMTGGGGGFTLELAPGRWTVTAVKSGFQVSEPRWAEVPPGGSVSIDPPIALVPVAASVSGRVTDGANAVAGASVVAVPRAGQVIRTTTNGFGEFVLLPQPSTYTLRAFASGYAPSDGHQVNISASDAFTGVELQVVPLECAVRGRVSDGLTQIASAVVTNGVSEVLTLPDGSFEFPLPRGVHELRASKPGYFSIAPMLVASMPGHDISGLGLRVAQGASTISGRVMLGGTQVARALVTATSSGGSAATFTDDSGWFSLPVEAGVWTLRAGKDGFSDSQDETILLADGQNATGVDLRIEDESALVLGSVTDGQGSVKRATVLLFAEGEADPVYRTTSSSSGVFRLRVAPRRQYLLRVRATGRGPVETSLPALEPGQQLSSNVVMQRRDGLIRGEVLGLGAPLAGALATVACGNTAPVRTDRLGNFSVWVDEGLYDVRIESPGYEPRLISDVEVVAGEPTEIKAELVGVHASLYGSVVDTTTSAPISGALVTASWPEGGSSSVTGPDGVYVLSDIVPGDVGLSCMAHGYRSDTRELTLEESSSNSLVLDLLELAGVIAGTVYGESGNGLSGASVRARLGNAVVSTTTTGDEGHYLLTGLDPALLYDVRANLGGYYAASENPLTALATQTMDADFTLLSCSGTIGGLVVDEVSGEPLEGAEVTAEDGQGHFGSDRTAEDGTFSINGLVPVSAYDLTASLFGYREAVAEGVAPGSESVSLALPRNFARVTGTVSSQSPEIQPGDVEIVATSTTYGGVSRLAIPDPSGIYEIAELRPGTYVASVSGPGCVSEPPQMLLVLGEGEVLSGLDFSIERALILRVEIGGPPSMAAGSAAVFTADAIANGERIVDTDLEWWISPAAAGAVERSTGRLVCGESYIGEATLAAREPESGKTGTLPLTVYAPVNAATNAAYCDSTGMRIEVRPGAVQGSRSIYLSHERVPNARRYRREFEIARTSYSLKPSGLVFDEGNRPILNLPAEAPGADVVLWDENELVWRNVASDARTGAVYAEIEQLGEYAISRDSAPLAVSDPRVEPNPFSPSDGPVTVSYDLSSSDARMPFVTVRVFNMASQLVRTVVENEPQGKGRASVEWDGLTDDGALARNGRYVVEIAADDASGSETALVTLVLVK